MTDHITGALINLGNEIARCAGRQSGVAAVVTVPARVYGAILIQINSATYQLRRAGFDDGHELRVGGLLQVETLGGLIVVKADGGDGAPQAPRR